MLRQAAIPIPPNLSWWCKPHSLEVVSNPGGTRSLVFTSNPDATWSYNSYGIVFGMTGHQVQRLLGKPAARQGRCWRYPMLPDSRAASVGVGKIDVGVCFFAGRVSDMVQGT